MPIAFASRTFPIIEFDEILDNADLIRNKIVLVGKVNDSGDMHVTPLSNFMPGIMIHAYCTSTLLDNSSPCMLPRTLQWIIASLCCYLVVWLSIMLRGAAGDLMVRIIQFTMLYLMIMCGTITY